MQERIRILLLDTGHEWGGGTNSMMELLKRLDRRRFSVTCCFYSDYRKGRDGPHLSEELARIGVPLIVLPREKQPLWAKIGKELARGLLRIRRDWREKILFTIEKRWRIKPNAQRIGVLIRDGRFDLLYLNNQPSSNLEGYLAAEIANVPVVQHCRIDTRLNAEEISIVNRLAKRIICVSQGVADSLKVQGIVVEKLSIVHNGIDIAQTVPAPCLPDGVSEDQLIIGTVGQLVKRKSVSDLLRAVAKLENEYGLRAHVMIVGEGPEATALQALANDLKISERVHFTGFKEDPLSLVAAMDVFVLASSREGLPRVILEAMLLGKPVVAANAVGSRELVVDRETGFLYPHGDIDRLAMALAELLTKNELRTQMGIAGQKRVRERFSIENYVSGVERHLGEAACSGSC